MLLMDADVLYDPEILERLVGADSSDALLLDRDFEPGDEPVKVCLSDEKIVEFGKELSPGLTYNQIGESVGFFRFSPSTAARLSRLISRDVGGGRRESPHEMAVRELVLSPDSAVNAVDVTGLPWIEIDFPADVDRARLELTPRIDTRQIPER